MEYVLFSDYSLLMAVLDPNAIFKKLGEDRARMEKLGVTENEMLKYYVSCGPKGKDKALAFTKLRRRLPQLSNEDAAFVEGVLSNCSPF